MLPPMPVGEGEITGILRLRLCGFRLEKNQRVGERWVDVMRHAIALNASFFNTHRMVQQYVTNAYLP